MTKMRTQTRKEPTCWRLNHHLTQKPLSGAAVPSLDSTMVLAMAWLAQVSSSRAVAASTASRQALGVALAVASSRLQLRSL